MRRRSKWEKGATDCKLTVAIFYKIAVSKGRFQKFIRAPTSAVRYEVGNGEIRLKVEFCD